MGHLNHCSTFVHRLIFVFTNGSLHQNDLNMLRKEKKHQK